MLARSPVVAQQPAVVLPWAVAALSQFLDYQILPLLPPGPPSQPVAPAGESGDAAAAQAAGTTVAVGEAATVAAAHTPPSGPGVAVAPQTPP